MREIINSMILNNIPSYLVVMIWYAIYFDLRKCLNPKKLFLFIFFLSLADSIATYTLPMAYQDLIKYASGAILLSSVYGFSPITSFISYAITYIVWFALNLIGMGTLSAFDISATEILTDKITYTLYGELIYIPILLLVTYVLAKKKWTWKWFAKRELSSKFGFDKYWRAHDKHLALFSFAIYIVMFMSYAILCYYTENKIVPDALSYFLFSVLICLAFTYPFINIIKDLDKANVKLGNYERNNKENSL